MECLIVCTLVDGDLDFFLLPRSQPVRPQEDDAGLAFVQRLGQRRLKLLTGCQVPLVEVRLESFFLGPLSHLMDNRTILGVVRQERIRRLRGLAFAAHEIAQLFRDGWRHPCIQGLQMAQVRMDLLQRRVVESD
jgi:hypothetical protein